MFSNYRQLQKKKYQPAGYTLVELLVSISIIAILTTLVIANFKGSNEKIILDNEAQRVASVIREMHINSLIGQTVGEVRPRGFGFNLETCIHTGAPDFCSYTSFADTSATPNYKLDANDTIMQTIRTFDKNVEFYSISTYTIGAGSPTTGITKINIAFIPPNGSIQFFIDNNATATTDETLEIVLRYYNSSYLKRIIINRISGQIDIQ